MREAASAFLRSRRDKTKLKDFQSDYNAEPWRVYEKNKAEDDIMALKDDRPQSVVPAGGTIAAITAGIDTQKYGFWFEIRAWGWGLTAESWQVRSGFVDSFEALARVLWSDVYPDAGGNKYIVNMAVIDAMGEKTAEVYDFCRIHRGFIHPLQGVDRLAQPFSYSNIEYYPGTKKPIIGGIKLVRANVTHYKNYLANKLDVAAGDPGAWHMNSEMTEEWARHMVSEYIDEKGLWQVKHNRDNHGWDCSVYNLVAADILGVKHWQKQDAKPEKDVKKEPNKTTNDWIGTRSGWLSR
jgi:phage terminase large subunit GpA-like protein